MIPVSWREVALHSNQKPSPAAEADRGHFENMDQQLLPELIVTVEIRMPDARLIDVRHFRSTIDPKALPIVESTVDDAWKYIMSIMREQKPLPPVHHGHD